MLINGNRIKEMEYKMRELEGKVNIIETEIRGVREEFIKSHDDIKLRLEEGFNRREVDTEKKNNVLEIRIEELKREQQDLNIEFTTLRKELEFLKGNTDLVTGRLYNSDTEFKKYVIGFVISVILLLIGMYIG